MACRPENNGYKVVIGTAAPVATKPIHLPPDAVTSPAALCEHLEQLDTDGHPQREEHTIVMLESEVIRLLSGARDLTQAIPKFLPGSRPPSRCGCDQLDRVAAQGVFLSGSRREGVAADKSDMDFMVEFGPFRMQPRDTWQSGRKYSEHVLLLKETDNPGFYLLWRAPKPNCGHPPLPFGQTEAKNMRKPLLDTMAAHNGELRVGPRSGPAQQLQGCLLLDDGHRKIDPKNDLVPCLRLYTETPPTTDFASRSRSHEQPTRKLVNKLAQLSPYVVPVGISGSEGARLQWRISYSQHEYNVFINMRPEQRACLRLLKRCKAELKLAQPIKSYYLKTALMWVCEAHSVNIWTWGNMYDNFLLVLDWIRTCIKPGKMPCYFDSRINLFANQFGKPGQSDGKLKELREAVDAMCTRLVPAVLSIFLKAGQISKNKWPPEVLEDLKGGTNQLPAKRLSKAIESTALLVHGACAGSQVPKPSKKVEMRRKTETDRSKETPVNTGNPSWRL